MEFLIERIRFSRTAQTTAEAKPTNDARTNDEIIEYNTDPELIYEEYENIVDAVIDGGYGGLIASTIIDCTGSEPEIIRQGSVEPEF